MELNKILVKRAFSDGDFTHVYDIRTKVFVEEQNVPEEDERDGYEAVSHHYLAYDDGIPCGCARWRVTPFGKIKLERFAVLKEHRGKRIGEALVKRILSELPPGIEIYLHAQDTAITFYERLGFIPEGEKFDECGIMHLKMVFPDRKS